MKSRTLEESIDIARDHVRGGDQGCIEDVNIFAGDRPLGMPQEGCDRYLREAQVIADAGETVPQDVSCNAFQRSVAKQLV